MIPNPVGPNPDLAELLLEATGINAVKQEVKNLHLSTLQVDFEVIKAHANATAGAMAKAAALPLLLMQTVPAFAIGLLGLQGTAAFSAGTKVLNDALTLVLHEHGFDLVKPHIEGALGTVYTDPAVRDQWTAAIHQAVINIGLLPAPDALDGTPAAHTVKELMRTADPLTRFVADGIFVVLEGRGLRAVVEPITASLQKVQDIATAGIDTALIVGGRIWDKATRVATAASTAAAVVHAELQAPRGWGNWVPSALRNSVVSVASSVGRIANHVQSQVEGYTRHLSAMHATFA